MSDEISDQMSTNKQWITNNEDFNSQKDFALENCLGKTNLPNFWKHVSTFSCLSLSTETFASVENQEVIKIIHSYYKKVF